MDDAERDDRNRGLDIQAIAEHNRSIAYVCGLIVTGIAQPLQQALLAHGIARQDRNTQARRLGFRHARTHPLFRASTTASQVTTAPARTSIIAMRLPTLSGPRRRAT